MDLTSINPNGSGGEERGEVRNQMAPFHPDQQVVRSPEPSCLEVFQLVNDKWTKVQIESFRQRTVKSTIFSNLMVKRDGYYYCGNDSVWEKLKDKDIMRKWMHDLYLDSNNLYTEGWLNKKVFQLLAI